MDRVEQMKKVQREGLELFTRKNKDYGDAFAEYGVVGVLMRIEDKIKRMMSISKTSVVLVNEETLRDTLIDLHNYSAMGIMLMDERITGANSVGDDRIFRNEMTENGGNQCFPTDDRILRSATKKS